MAKSSTKFNPTFLTFNSQRHVGSVIVTNELGQGIGIIVRTAPSSGLYRYLFLSTRIAKDKAFLNLRAETYYQLKTELIDRYEKKYIKGKTNNKLLDEFLGFFDEFTKTHPDIYEPYCSVSVDATGGSARRVRSIRFKSIFPKYRKSFQEDNSALTIVRSHAYIFQLNKRLIKVK